MPRTILAHLNIEIADADPRNADEVGDWLLGRLESGLGLYPGALASGAEKEAAGGELVCLALIEEI